MKMGERNIALRLVMLLVGLITISIVGEILKVILFKYSSVTSLGAIPHLLIYGVPMVWLMKWVGFFKSKEKPAIINTNIKPQEENWNTSGSGK